MRHGDGGLSTNRTAGTKSMEDTTAGGMGIGPIGTTIGAMIIAVITGRAGTDSQTAQDR
jgi:hypothetical protein